MILIGMKRVIVDVAGLTGLSWDLRSLVRQLVRGKYRDSDTGIRLLLFQVVNNLIAAYKLPHVSSDLQGKL